MENAHVRESLRPFAGDYRLTPIDIDADEQREAWLRSRLEGYGGSDVVAIVGEGKKRRAVDVWEERRGGVESFDGNERTEVGRLLEPVVLNWFEVGEPKWPHRLSDICVVKPPSAFHASRPWQRGSADGLVYDLQRTSVLGERAS